MARCLIFKLERGKPQANKNQEHEGKREKGDWESVWEPQGSWEWWKNLQAKRKRESSLQLESLGMIILSMLVLIKEKKSDNSVRQEKLHQEERDREGVLKWGVMKEKAYTRKKGNNGWKFNCKVLEGNKTVFHPSTMSALWARLDWALSPWHTLQALFQMK